MKKLMLLVLVVGLLAPAGALLAEDGSWTGEVLDIYPILSNRRANKRQGSEI